MLAGCHNQDVGLAGELPDALRVLVTEEDRRRRSIFLRQKQGQRLPNDIRLAENHTALSSGLNAVMLDHPEDACRSGWQEDRRSKSKLAEIHRVEAINVLRWVYVLQDLSLMLAQSFWQRQLHDDSMSVAVRISRTDHFQQLGQSGVHWQGSLGEANSNLLCRQTLLLDIYLRRWIIADVDDMQVRAQMLALDTRLQLGQHAFAQGLAVKQLRSACRGASSGHDWAQEETKS
mmetsp:Transcript_18223/g.33119  ORF Transcript_18223/g.33119 Transcript_18223/m.33119 type:complete len:232 (-) Transcript_18223:21-716(-)